MNTSSFPFRGPKLFLPKIIYEKLNDNSIVDAYSLKASEEKHFSDCKDDRNLAVDSQTVPLLNESYDFTSFTRFDVLPPISHRRNSTRVRRVSNARRLSTNFSSTQGNYMTARNRRPSFARWHNICQETNEKGQIAEDLKGLEVKGNSYGETAEGATIRGKWESGNSNMHKLAIGVTGSNRRGKKLLETVSGKDRETNIKTDYNNIRLSLKQGKSQQDKQASDFTKKRREPFIRSMNSDKQSMEESNINNSSVRVDSEKLSVCQPSRRPVSRNHIDLDLQEHSEGESVQKREENRPNELLLQVNTKPTMELKGTRRRSEVINDRRSALGGHVDILLETLDFAKKDLTKETLGVPFTSTREQRRRSALCRNKPKQVEDFLLVHNLRDLGLL